jgi:NDP-sugar pyrophosphorylase family protein
VLIKEDLLDIGYDLLPKLSRRSYGYLLKDFLMDVGSYDDLDRVNKIPYEAFSYMLPL